MQKNVFMVGMPGSGKTTYLGATWILLSDGTASTLYSKAPGIVPDDNSRLEAIAKDILDYNVLERTKQEENTKLDIMLNDQKGNKIFINIPDLAGEIFRDLVNDRRIRKSIVSNLLNADCILFFTYYENMAKESRIQSGDGHNEENDNSLGIDFQIDEKREANESEVVELLLALLEILRKSIKPINIRFIMSAWDMVEKKYGHDILPEGAMREMFPLLYQCIQCNSDRMNYEFWGVAALGGDLNDPNDKKRIQIEELEAICVVTPKGKKSNDLTAVLAGMGDEK